MSMLKKQRDEAIAEASKIVNGAKAAVRSMTDDEKSRVDELIRNIEGFEKDIKTEDENNERMAKVGALFGGSGDEKKSREQDNDDEILAKSKTVGQYVVNLAKAKGINLSQRNATFETPELKANTDTHVTGGIDGFYEPWLVDFQKDNPVRPVRQEPVISDLISWATTNAQAIKYIEYPTTLLEGSAGTVLEGGTKPQVHIGTPITRLDPVTEIAAWFKLTDDVLEDLPRLVSEIDRELRDNFADVEAAQILRGDGTAPNLKGILNRSGLQSLTVARGADDDASMTALLEGIMQASLNIKAVTGKTASGLAIHPTDYFKARMLKDGNGQYFAGGPFGGNYGQNGLSWATPIWGLPTIVTTMVDQGKPIVADWKSATAYRKGGLKIESTNSHENDFTNDRVTIRWRTKLGLAVRKPASFVLMNQA